MFPVLEKVPVFSFNDHESEARATVFVETYLHAAQVAMPFRSTHHSSWDVFICKTIARRTINKTNRLSSPQSNQLKRAAQGRGNAYLIYLGNWADPCASTDGYLHKEMPNALKFLCFPLPRRKI